jgi:hypothetical protein
MYVSKPHLKPDMVVHSFNPSTREAEAGRFLSLRPARATLRNPVWKKQTKQKKKKKKKNQIKAPPWTLDVSNHKIVLNYILCVCVCVCVYTHTCIHTYTYIYMYTHTPWRSYIFTTILALWIYSGVGRSQIQGHVGLNRQTLSC